jgi:hypothetical protein
MATKRNSWQLGVGLCCLCLALVPLTLAGVVKADPVLTVLPANVVAAAINDSGKVAGTDASGHGFLRMPDGSTIIFSASSPDTQNQTWPQCINDKDVIAGSYADYSESIFHAFVRAADGTIVTFDAPGVGQNGGGTFPTSINAKGVVTGYYMDASYMPHGFVRAADNTVTNIDVPGASQTTAMGINDKGVIVGSAMDGNTGTTRGFIRSPAGALTIFEAQGGAFFTQASAIDDKGTLTGGFSLNSSDPEHGFIRRSNGVVTTFDTGKKWATQPVAISATGDVAGTTFAKNQHATGFVRLRNGEVTAIAVPKYDVYPRGINRHGVVVGTYQSKPQQPYANYGFIWTP